MDDNVFQFVYDNLVIVSSNKVTFPKIFEFMTEKSDEVKDLVARLTFFKDIYI